jgi:hypothetical protein
MFLDHSLQLLRKHRQLFLPHNRVAMCLLEYLLRYSDLLGHNSMYSVSSNDVSIKHIVSLLTPRFMHVSCFAYSRTLKKETTYSSEISLDFSELHDVISQKMEPFWTEETLTFRTIFKVLSDI